MKYIANCSFGKDSIAQLLIAKKFNEPLDRVVFVECMFDIQTGISGEIQEHIDFVQKTAIPRLSDMFDGKVEFDVVRTEIDYVHIFNHIVTRSKVQERNGKCHGFLISGSCKMNSAKVAAIYTYYKNLGDDIFQYVGIAADEKKRLERLHKKTNTVSLLEKYNVDETSAFEMCREYELLSPIYYEYGRRSGCWFCPNAKVDFLRKFRKNHPDIFGCLSQMSNNENKVTEKFNRKYTFKELIRELDRRDRQYELF